MGGVLALDPATVIGWAHAEPGGGKPTWGHQRLGRLGAETDEIAEALGLFLDARIDVLNPRYIVREDFYIGGGRVPMNPQTIYVLCGIAWQIDLAARRRGIGCYKVQTSTMVRYFTGRGKYPDRAAKKRATVRVCQFHGWTCTSDEADAIALLCYAEAKLFPEMRLSMRRPAGPLFAR